MGKLNKLLTLTFLFLACYASWYWVQHKKIEKEGLAVFKSSLESAHTIRIAVRSKPQIGLVKRSGRWYIVEPVEDMADEAKVGELFAYAQEIQKERIITPSVRNLSIFGLSPPEAVLAFETASGPQGLNFGHKTIDEEKVFACTSGSKEVFLVLSEARKKLSDQPFQFRERRLLLLDKNEIKVLNVVSNGTEIGFTRSESGWSQTLGPLRQDMLKMADEIIQDLGRSFILDFIKANDGRAGSHGLDPPRLRVRVDGTSGTQTFLFGNEGPQGFVYARTRGRPGVMLVEKPHIWRIRASSSDDQS